MLFKDYHDMKLATGKWFAGQHAAVVARLFSRHSTYALETTVRGYLARDVKRAHITCRALAYSFDAVDPHHHLVLLHRMASELSAVRNDLQRWLGSLNELVARVATLSPAGDKHWPLVGNKLSHLHSDFTVHIAIIQLLLSRTTQDAQTSAELDKFTQTLQAGGGTLEALRVALFPTPPNQAGEDKPSSPLTFPQTETPQQLEQLSVSLRAAMASLFLSFSPGDSTSIPRPSSDSNSEGTLALEDAFLRRPFALTSADVSSLVASLGSPDPKSAIEAISAQVNDLAKTWAAGQAAVGVAIEPSALINLWCGDAWSSPPSGDLQGQLSSPDPEPAPPNEDALLAANGFVGARVRKSVSDQTSIAFIGSSRCGKSSLINAIVGFPVIAAGGECNLVTGFTISKPVKYPHQYPVEYGISLA